MKEKIINLHLLLLFVLLLVTGCNSGKSEGGDPGKAALLSYFTPLTTTDTLHFFLDSAPMPAVREVPVPVLYGALDSVLFYQMGYMQDTAAMKTIAHGLFPLDAAHDAALLELQEGWFAYKYLLIFDKSTNQFTHVTPVCEFFGGDGGQIRSESWLFFEDPPRLLTRFSEHWLQMGTEEDPEEVQENFNETAQLQEWLGLEWRETPVLDSSRWVRGFPVGW